MATVFDGMDFEGPNPLESLSLPSAPGIYIVATEASGGVKMLGIYQADDMLADFSSHEKRECWEKNADQGLDVFYRQIDDIKERDRACRKMISDRWYRLDCVDPPRDDF